MYRGVPSRLSWWVMPGSASRRARPKSVTQMLPLRVDQQVRGLDVAVDDTFVMGVRQCIGRLVTHRGDPAKIRRTPRRIEWRRLLVVASSRRIGRPLPAARPWQGDAVAATPERGSAGRRPAGSQEAVNPPIGSWKAGAEWRRFAMAAESPGWPLTPAASRPRHGVVILFQSRVSREPADDGSMPACPSVDPRPAPAAINPLPLTPAAEPSRRAAKMAYHAIQAAPFYPLHCVIAKAADLADVEDGHDVGVMQSGRGACLVKEPPPRRWNPAWRAHPAP